MEAGLGYSDGLRVINIIATGLHAIRQNLTDRLEKIVVWPAWSLECQRMLLTIAGDSGWIQQLHFAQNKRHFRHATILVQPKIPRYDGRYRSGSVVVAAHDVAKNPIRPATAG